MIQAVAVHHPRHARADSGHELKTTFAHGSRKVLFLAWQWLQMFLVKGTLICMGLAGASALHAEQLSTTNPSDWPTVVPRAMCDQAPYRCVGGSYAFHVQGWSQSGTFWTTSQEACQASTGDPGAYYVVHATYGEGCYYHPYRSQGNMAEIYAQGLVARSGTCHGVSPVVGSATRTWDEPVRCVICASGFGQIHSDSNYCVPVINHVRGPSTSPNMCSAKGEPITPNPFYPLKGYKRQSENLIAWRSSEQLSMTYDTRSKVPSAGSAPVPAIGPALPSFGELWASNMHKRLVISRNNSSSPTLSVSASRGAGVWTSFAPYASGAYQAEAGISDQLIPLANGWRYVDASSRALEQYDANGVLTGVTFASGETVSYVYSDASTPVAVAPTPGLLIQLRDTWGRTARFEYAAAGSSARIVRIIDAAAQVTGVSYDAAGNLASLTWPDGKVRQFLYEQATQPWAMTGILDENNQRYSTYGYDAQGRAVSAEKAGGVSRYSVSHATPPAWNVTEGHDSSAQVIWRDYQWQAPTGTTLSLPTGDSTGYASSLVNGSPRMTSQSQAAGSGCGASSSSLGYDGNGNVAVEDDFNGNRTCRVHDLRNLEVTRVEGLAGGTSCASVTSAGASLPTGARKIGTQWHPDWLFKTKEAEPGQLTTWVYNGQPDPFNGNAIASCAPSTAKLPDGKPIAVLCKKVEQATTDANGGQAAYEANASSSSVTLLLHMDGADGGTSFVDSSPLNRTATRGGSAVTRSAPAKFGASGQFMGATSDKLVFDGTAATQLTGDFTIEAFVLWNTLPTANAGIFSSGHELYLSASTGTLRWFDGSSNQITGTTAVTAGVWHHVALVRQAGTLTVYLDGQPQGSYNSTATLGSTGSNAEVVGAWYSGEFMNGFIDEFRITKGQSLYGGVFAPPTGPGAGAGGSQNPAVNTAVPQRAWRYTYNQFGQVLTEDGPRTDVSDVTAYAYYTDTTADHTQGDLQSVTNAAGKVTQFTKYDKQGQLLQSTDPNGVVTVNVYDARRRLTSSTVGGQATTFAYDFVGQLTRVTLPDTSYVNYTYDAAHRLVAVADQKGNRIDYTLDNAGNRTGEMVKDLSGTLQRQLSRSMDALGRVQQTNGR